MPNESLVVFIAAHGAVSNRSTVIPVENYNVVFLTSAGHRFDLPGYNLSIRLLLNGHHAGELPHNPLDMIEALPSTVSVSINNLYQSDPHILSGNFDLNDALVRAGIIHKIELVKNLATNSQHAWNLLEHKLFPASDVLGLPQALSPSSPATLQNFAGFEFTTLITPEFSNSPTTTLTLDIYVDINKIASSIQNAAIREYTVCTSDNSQINVKECTFSNDQVIYITPRPAQQLQQHILLSEMLYVLGHTHFFVEKTVDEHSVSYRVMDAVIEASLDDFFNQEGLLTSQEIYDLKIPDNANVLLGVCRDPGDF